MRRHRPKVPERIGDNAVAARLTGVNINLRLISVYTLAGLIYGVAALGD